MRHHLDYVVGMGGHMLNKESSDACLLPLFHFGFILTLFLVLLGIVAETRCICGVFAV